MIKRPDEYGHNNPDYAFVDSKAVRGGGREVADLAALYAIPADLLQRRVTKVYVIAEAKTYVLIDLANKSTAAGWEVETGGSGANGLSAYEIAVNNGFVGTELQWLASLQGNDGADGVNGQDGANGADGQNGKSAYQSYFDTTTDNPKLTEEQWSSARQTKELLISKSTYNSIAEPGIYKNGATAKQIIGHRLTTNATDFSITIYGVTYDKTATYPIVLAANAELIINDVTIQTGYNIGNVILIIQ